MTLVLITTLSCVHIFAHKITIIEDLPRRKWLSLAGGISVAFVFLHILPELHEMHDLLNGSEFLSTLQESGLYAMAMAGILLFYGLERLVIHLQEWSSSDQEGITDHTIFWFHIGMYALFNSFIGYYLHHELEVQGISSLLTFIALAFHFLVNDYSLFRHHKEKYHHTGRWVMAGAVIAGWMTGAGFTIPGNIPAFIFALVAGAIIVNSFKEELPEEKESNFTFFLLGAVVYTLFWIL